ncbi:hypothetical protein CK203_103791 [Vitis vinifera]|uniref:Uncharacterized protein n=1 Tax=Vitis vinifera TaxID=29760 RepID=A0A438CI07_VITVI|nr:hypothetical protein CK203_103791 [Vitis vinifera]
METIPEDQHSHHGHQDNPNEIQINEDCMHPPRMSAPSCIVPSTEQLVIRPHIVPLLPTFHGMEIYFYDGMSSSMKQLLETMCGGDFMSKNPEEAMDFLSYVAEVSRGWMNRTQENYDKKSGGARTEKDALKCKLLLKHQCKFPSQPHQNPKGIHEVETHEGESSQVRDVKALITLRSNKKVESPTPKLYVEEKEEEETKKREEMKGKKKRYQ